MQSILKQFLTPAAWIASIAAFVGVAGLAFNVFLSLMVGAQVANQSSVTEHFGAGASLLAPGVMYAVDLGASILYVVVFFLVVWFALILAVRLAVAAAHLVVKYLVRISEIVGRSSRMRGLQKILPKRVLAEAISKSSRFVHDNWLLGGVKHVWESRRVVFTFVALVVAAFVMTLWIPYVEAQRYLEELSRAAKQSVLPRPDAEDDRTVALRVKRARFPVLSFLSTVPNRWLDIEHEGYSSSANWFGQGASGLKQVVSSVPIWDAVDNLLARPKLVVIGLNDKVMRPMLTVALYSDTVVLYDFLYDNNVDDKVLYPLRTFKQSGITNVTAINPGIRTAGENPKPIFSILTAACGRNPLAVSQSDGEEERLRKKEISTECNKATWSDASACIRREFINLDVLRCQQNEASAADGKPESEGSRKLELSFAPEAMQLVKTSLEALAERASTFFVVSPPAAYAGRWAKCERLSNWASPENGIEFKKGSADLRSERRHGLAFGRGAATTASEWDVFSRVMDEWVAASIKAQSRRGDEQPVLFLIGRASQDGANVYNYRLTERRALAVRQALLDRYATSTAQARRLRKARLVTDEMDGERNWIIALGEGESVLAPEEMIDNTKTRRVDARLCFVSREEPPKDRYAANVKTP